jgi:predicted hydrocarbon binding protein
MWFRSQKQETTVDERVTAVTTAIKELNVALPFALRIDNGAVVFTFKKALGRKVAEDLAEEFEDLLKDCSITLLDKSKTTVTFIGVL